MPSPADELDRALTEFETPPAVVDARLALARAVSAELEGVVAALVVGSTALGRCSPSADLDVVVVADGDAGFETRWVDGVRVEIERIGRQEALAATEGEAWVWELRQAARLGTGIPVLDPHGFGAGLAARAAAMRPSRERFEATLGDVYLRLIEVAGHRGDDVSRTDALRGCLDNLVVLALHERPRRYQKPKWALADLLHAGEHHLVDAVLAAYGTTPALVGARALVGAVLQSVGAPAADELLALGHAPQWAEAGYVARTLDDAADLDAGGRRVEAAYVARFAARLSGALLAAEAGAGGLVDAFERHGLVGPYRALFPAGGAEAGDDLLAAALAAADARRSAVPA